MALDLARQRTDLPYLRRRLRPEDVAKLREQQRAQAPAPRPSLSLSSPQREAAKTRYEVPTLTTRGELSPAAPVIRLSKRSSAIGSLTISGASTIYWQTNEASGVQRVNDSVGDGVPTFAGRALVQGYKGFAVIGLRHVRQLRRILVEGPATLVVETATGHKLEVAQVDGQPVRLSILNLSGTLELRREHEDAGLDFGFSR